MDLSVTVDDFSQERRLCNEVECICAKLSSEDKFLGENMWRWRWLGWWRWCFCFFCFQQGMDKYHLCLSPEGKEFQASDSASEYLKEWLFDSDGCAVSSTVVGISQRLDGPWLNSQALDFRRLTLWKSFTRRPQIVIRKRHRIPRHQIQI